MYILNTVSDIYMTAYTTNFGLVTQSIKIIVSQIKLIVDLMLLIP